MSDPKPFLTAHWRHLVMLNYPVESSVLEPMVPAGTVLDTYQGRPYVSVVAFLFLRARVRGIAVPFHQDFEEVNLRFYVRRFADGEWRRGVVFLRELVPRLAIATVARRLYNENYHALPMRHAIAWDPSDGPRSLHFEWQHEDSWQGLKVATSGERFEPRSGSLEEFITEHYWGYTRQRDGGSLEYQVQHPRWQLWRATVVAVPSGYPGLAEASLASALDNPPATAFVAEGSEVRVFPGRRLEL